MLNKVADGAMPLVKRERAIQFRAVEAEKMARSAMMGFIEQGRFDEGRALLATAADADGNPGPLPLPPDAVKELSGVLEERRAEATALEARLDRVDTVVEGTAGPTDDPTEWRALVEEHFAVVAPQRAELDPAERIGAEDDYVRNLGHLPKPLMRFLRAGMLSGEPKHEAAAALRLKTLGDHDPALIEAIPEAERTRAAAIAEFAELAPQAAAALRLKTLGDHDPALIEAIPEAERTRAAAIAEFAELGLKPERAVELADERLVTVADAIEEQVLDLRGQIGGGITDDAKEIGKPDGRPGVPNKKPAERNEIPEVSISETRLDGPCREIYLDFDENTYQLGQVYDRINENEGEVNKTRLEIKSLNGELSDEYLDLLQSAISAGLSLPAGSMLKVITEAAQLGMNVAKIHQILRNLDILGEQLKELEQEAVKLEEKRLHRLRKEALLKKTIETMRRKTRQEKSP